MKITSILNQEQISKSIELLNKIRTDEGELFPDYVNDEYRKINRCIVYGFARFFEDGENCGIFASMMYYGIFRVFVAFEKDTDKYSKELAEFINLVKKENPGRSPCVHFIADQTKLIGSMRKTMDFDEGFYASNEFVMDKEHFKGFVNDMQLEIRPYELDKVGDYALLLDNSMTFVSPPTNFQGDTAGLAEKIWGNAFSAFYKDGDLAGLYWLDNDSYTIDIIAVSPEYQRHGYGGIILSHAIDNVFTVQKHDAAKLYCVDWNKKGYAFYKKFGMIEKGHTYSMNLKE
ncbi:MAG: GNAT family N-acetyltransferase [Oscillospiraceae bacterium]|nr:GNAT family N-acetyltransferase [Oscillospiraceae bacterium]